MNWHQACELPYYHGSDLGANPTAEETTFKLWAPTACGVVVCLYATGTDAEPGAKKLGVHEMRRGDDGVCIQLLNSMCDCIFHNRLKRHLGDILPIQIFRYLNR